MESMSLEIDTLRALLRLARRRTPATLAELLVRVDTDAETLARVVERLVRTDLAFRVGAGVRLSLGGLAVAAASCPPIARRRPAPAAKPVRAPAAVLPLLRRRPAA